MSKTSTSGNIAIAGAGLGGLTAALALMTNGWRVRVYEQAPVLGEVGAGITLSSGAGQGLSAFGLGPALLAASLPVPDIAFVHYKTGALLSGVLDQAAPPDLGFARARHIHRADLHNILLTAVRTLDPEAIAIGHRLAGIDQTRGGVVVHFANGSSARADALVAADGVRSTARQILIGEETPDFAGQIAFRCLISRAAAEPFMGGGNAVVSIGAARIFNRYLIRGGEVLNVIGIAKSQVWKKEGWSTPATIAEFADEFEGFHSDVLGLIAQAPPENLIKWGLFVRPPLTQWSSGRVLLIGDAAHPMLPFLGLGAATAIEDGIVIARTLALGMSMESAFSAFQRSRFGRVEAVRTQSILQGKIIQANDPDRTDMAGAPSGNAELFDYNPCTAPLAV